jgi:hypothetical protein
MIFDKRTAKIRKYSTEAKQGWGEEGRMEDWKDGRLEV